MAVPKKKSSRSAQGGRRSHHALKKTNIVSCTNCGAPVLPHTACKVCGTYRGRKVGDVLSTSKSATKVKAAKSAKTSKAKA